jgi:hypothetical protein
MALQLYFKRAKIFLHTNPDGVSKRYYATISARGPVVTPSWLSETLTFKHGINDGSIVDLTPPKPLPRSKKAAEAAIAAQQAEDAKYEQNTGAASTGADAKEGAEVAGNVDTPPAELTVGNGRAQNKKANGLQGRNRVPGGTLEV